MTAASPQMEAYFSEINTKLEKCYDVAGKARSKGLDPEDKVDIPLAKNMAERVEGLISVVYPQIIGSGLSKRIEELEKQYGALALEVALTIAEEVTAEKFCKFGTKKEAMEVGIRTGFAYVTTGVVSAPLEGFVELKIKQRNDGKEYLAALFAGPVRGAGGTAMAFCLVITDYVRKKNGYDTYDATEAELNRYVTELSDYHERITNLQYKPSSEEIKFLMRHCPIEVDGTPTEKFDVSNFKDLPRVETNRIRGGVCLVVSMLALKAPKLWKELKRVQKNFDIDWTFTEDFIVLQKQKKSHSTEDTGKKISPDFTYISDLVAGRPVLTYPLRIGGFRLRYGKTRSSGYSAAAIHPATMIVLDKYIATGTQLKVERPGKAAAVTACQSIDGPIVKLKNGSVIRLDTEQEARNHTNEIKEILYLGDYLVSYGDFYDRAHALVPAGYSEDWHSQQLKKAVNESPDLKLKVSAKTYNSHKFPNHPDVVEALTISKELNIPLHPRYTYFWNAVSTDRLVQLLSWLKQAKISDRKIILPLKEEKHVLELLGVPHTVSSNEFVVIGENDSQAILSSLGLDESLKDLDDKIKLVDGNLPTLEIVNKLSNVEIQDKCGTFIGARMGRPEKAKMRKLTGGPQVLFPVGEAGGRLRSMQAAMDTGQVVADFPNFYCKKCDSKTVYPSCERCGERCKQEAAPSLQSIKIFHYFQAALKKLRTSAYPDLIKGVRGTTNKGHIPENLLKGILRAKHGIYVNKDGTTRYDMSELPITHFKPYEIRTPVERLVELGYTHDINGELLTQPKQLLEIKPQDLILPSSPEATEESSDVVLFNVSKFVDEMLTSLYGLAPFYKLSSKQGLIGHLVIGLAPHISAGVVGRIIGFSKTQGFLAHPLFHAAMRRDADGDESCVMLVMDALINFSRQYLPDSRGATMDSPLVITPRIIPGEVDDMVHRFDVAWEYPLRLYEAALQYKMPWEVQVELLGFRLGTEKQYEGIGFTHDQEDINSGVLMSAYKTLPSMQEKLKGQMELAEKIVAVDEKDVARLVIEKHLLKDIRGNLRKFSTQQFRCVKCNKKFRRPPLQGACDNCMGKILFTVSKGTIVKYLDPAMSLADKYSVSPYLLQVLDLTKMRIADAFGDEKEKQEGLGRWFG